VRRLAPPLPQWLLAEDLLGGQPGCNELMLVSLGVVIGLVAADRRFSQRREHIGANPQLDGSMERGGYCLDPALIAVVTHDLPPSDCLDRPPPGPSLRSRDGQRSKSVLTPSRFATLYSLAMSRPADRVLDLAGERLLRSFTGTAPTPGILGAIRARSTSGVTLFRAKNVESPGQLRALTAELQAARPAGDPPLIVALDQEGGQLQAVGSSLEQGAERGATAWPGNLAIAATGSVDLARRTGVAIGLELAAMGANVDFAPVCDLLDDPRNPVMGTRTFGDSPALAAQFAAAFVRGMQSVRVGATLKHLPGHGAVAGDSHLSLPVLDIDEDRLRARELAPFRAGISAGARLVMLGHLAVPALTGNRSVPATLAVEVAGNLVRDELGFRGVTITDALDMGALATFGRLPELAVLAAAAGNDLLLSAHPTDLEDEAVAALAAAMRSGRLDLAVSKAAARRIRTLRRWLAGGPGQPALSVVGSVEHRALAREIAERSITLLRDREGLLPVDPGRHIDVVTPQPGDLTPADTSSYLRLSLADALRSEGLHVDELVIEMDPSDGEIATVRASLAASLAAAPGGLAVVGTIDALAHPQQARLVTALVEAGIPTVAVALRTPLDLGAYPTVGTALATYGLQPPTLEALARAVTGRIAFQGRLPVRPANGMVEAPS
jgi:beta-N-acetylhexosaminidase